MGNSVGEGIWDNHPTVKKQEAIAKKATEKGIKAANKGGPLKPNSEAARRKGNTTAAGKAVSKSSTINTGIGMKIKTPVITNHQPRIGGHSS